MDSREKLRNCLRNSLKTDHEQIVDELVSRSEFVRAPKGTRLFRENDHIEDCYCLQSGVTRMFYENPDGMEITEWINFEPGTIIYPSYELGEEIIAKASCETVTDCEMARIHLSVLLDVTRRYPEFSVIRLRLLQSTLDRQARIKRGMAHKSPAERYEWFLENWPDVAEKVPQKHIASFLSMTPVSLSRIRSRYKKKLAAE